MRVFHQDLGADVVYLPDRQILVIHPDLGYGDAIGAVSGTLPSLALRDVARLVEKVIAPPRPRRRLARLVAAAGLTVGGLVSGIVLVEPATAAPFGQAWQDEMTRMGYECHHDVSAWVCLDAENDPYKVTGYRQENASLYHVDGAEGDLWVLVFDDRQAARKWQATHPDSPVVGRIAAL